MIMFSPHKPRFVLKQCNNHDKITCVDRLEENPRLCSKQQSKNGAFPERTARSQQYAGHGERRKRHTRHNHDVFSVQRTTAIVRTILLLSIFALLAECRELPQPSVRNLGESCEALWPVSSSAFCCISGSRVYHTPSVVTRRASVIDTIANRSGSGKNNIQTLSLTYILSLYLVLDRFPPDL